MSTNHEKWIELADLYAVGALDGGDASEFQAHLQKGCVLCEARIAENETAVAGLVGALAPLEAPAALKSRIMETIGAGEEAFETAENFQPGFSPLWGALAWVLVSAGIVFGWKATSLNRHTVEFKRMEASVMASSVKTVEMKTPDSKTPGFAKVVWSEKGDCIFMTMGLPHPSKDKTYQLWGITGDQKISAGVFQVDEHGCGVLVMKKDVTAAAFEKMAVTLEPAGGVPSPTGPIVLLGSL